MVGLQLRRTINNDLISECVRRGRWYELDELECLNVNVLPYALSIGETCIDVGANIGTFTVYMATGRFDHLISFEPQGVPFDCLQENTLGMNVEAVNLGLSDRAGWWGFDEERGNTGAARIRPDGFSTNETHRSFQTVRLNDWLKFHKRRLDVGMVKLDIEGHELQALVGMSNLFVDRRPVVVVEIMKRHFNDNGECPVERYLRRSGYDYVYAIEEGALHRVDRVERKINPMVVFSPEAL